MEAEVAEFCKKMEAHWRSKAVEVYALAGQAVDSDPRRTPEYRAKVIEGLRLGPSENRPRITEADLAAINRWLAARPRRFESKELPVLRSESLRLRGLRSVPNRTRSRVRRCSGLTIGSKRRAQSSPFRGELAQGTTYPGHCCSRHRGWEAHTVKSVVVVQTHGYTDVLGTKLVPNAHSQT